MSDLTLNYEILDTRTNELVRVNLMDLQIGLEQGYYSTNFGAGKVEEPVKVKGRTNANDKA